MRDNAQVFLFDCFQLVFSLIFVFDRLTLRSSVLGQPLVFASILNLQPAFWEAESVLLFFGVQFSCDLGSPGHLPLSGSGSVFIPSFPWAVGHPALGSYLFRDFFGVRSALGFFQRVAVLFPPKNPLRQKFFGPGEYFFQAVLLVRFSFAPLFQTLSSEGGRTSSVIFVTSFTPFHFFYPPSVPCLVVRFFFIRPLPKISLGLFQFFEPSSMSFLFVFHLWVLRTAFGLFSMQFPPRSFLFFLLPLLGWISGNCSQSNCHVQVSPPKFDGLAAPFPTGCAMVVCAALFFSWGVSPFFFDLPVPPSFATLQPNTPPRFFLGAARSIG